MSTQHYDLAFVFPGQGSQSVGMMADLAAGFPEIKQTFERASDALGKDLWTLVGDGPEADLNQTQNTQPAMLAAGFAIWEVWRKQCSIRPAWTAGHSLGEYTALVAAHAIAFEDAIKLVAVRGRLMQEAVPPGTGAMAAILGLEDHQIVEACKKAAQGEVVEAVNFNAPGQVVIAGHASAVQRAIAEAQILGAKRAVPLPVSVPSHCALMRDAADKLGEELSRIQIDSPEMTLIHNTDVMSHSAPEVIRNALKEQLFKPVRWVDSIRFMHDQGVTRIVECGPGKVLIGLNKRIAKDAEHLSIFDTKSFHTTLEQLNG
ncbi:ACP S-malonyltransferase [Methylomicrobium album]|uniref:Malonyl CoA-acyl carrier protein transacylase n=1 Tax=Methylomicrobium album BG8 TaxID=686340 RepID=H8GM38_METAL|nr:ACP S-malonyltransferase [Methylomicrobium album]EIC29399.1 malonyl CoA-acyl carrier protein transacylase [Methylomicrobium album BG8]